ncbi:MAG: amidohydrolase family protein [Bacteroidetes bacterium]|nr:amidohydrolase family protein [Bacteroidota bacterium]
MKFKPQSLFTGHTIIEGGNTVVVTTQDGTIVDVIPAAEAGDDCQELSGMLSPGFINAHCHLELSHLKGAIPTQTGLSEFVKQIVPKRAAAQEIIDAAIDAAETEMLDNGIVAVGDICNTADTIAAKTKGKIAYYNFIEIYGLDPLQAAQKMEAGMALQNEYINNGLKAVVVPHAPYSVPAALLQLLAAAYGSHTVSIHNQETKAENDFFENKIGAFVDMYARVGVELDFFTPTKKTSLQSVLPYLKDAAKTIWVHNSFTSVSDIDAVLATNTDAYWCLCPSANQYIENTMPPVQLLRAQGANIIVGTDSYASNWSLNMLDELKKIQAHNPAIPLAEMLTWITSNGARALQMDNQLGSIEKGKKPGLVLIENITNQTPLNSNSFSKRLV